MRPGFIVGVPAVIAAELAAGYPVPENGVVPINADSQPGRFETWTAMPSWKGPVRPGNLDPGAVFQAHGQAPARGRKGMAKGDKLNRPARDDIVNARAAG
ncbi:MAG TPA: hypothetical protein VGF07_03300 [Stellaceae bacterium]